MRINRAAENSWSVQLLIIRTISHTSSFTNITKIIIKSFQDQNTHTLFHTPTFIPKYFSNKSTKTPFGHFLIIHDEVFKNVISRKNMLCRKWRKKMEMYYWIRINLQLAIQKPFRESLQYRTFLKANSKFIGDFL